MRLPVYRGDVPTPALIRRADLGDAQALADVHATAWREAYAGLVPESVLVDRASRGLARWQEMLADPIGTTHWIALRAGSAVGFAWGHAAGPGHPRPLELQGLYVLAGEYGVGSGQRLLDITIGDAPCFLWVARDNPRAVAFYRRNGFGPDGGEQAVQAWGGLPLVRMVR